MIAGNDLVVDADLLVHRAFISGERHDFAHRFEAGEHIVDPGLDSGRALADPCGNELCLRNTQLRGQVALTHFRIVVPSLPDLARGGLYQRIHLGFLLVQNELALTGDLQPIERAVVLDPDLVVPLEERLARDHTDGRLGFCRMLPD